MRMGGQRHAPAALTPGKIRYPLYRRLGGPQGQYGRVQKISPPTGIPSPDRPDRRKSLYRLCYPNPTTRMFTHTHTHTQINININIYIYIHAGARRSPAELQIRHTGTLSAHSLWYRPAVFSATFASLRFHSRMEKITARFIITISILLILKKFRESEMCDMKQ